jgi:hypothetical protein
VAGFIRSDDQTNDARHGGITIRYRLASGQAEAVAEPPQSIGTAN